MSIINEQIVTGRKFRKLIDEASRLWLRISFWTKACDVEFDDGETAETKFSNMLNTINDLKQSFQDGVNKIYNYLKGLGFTPNPNSPDGICTAIKNIYDKRYSDGRTQGQVDVVANPEGFGVVTGIPVENIMWGESRADFDVMVFTHICTRGKEYVVHYKVGVFDGDDESYGRCLTQRLQSLCGARYLSNYYDEGGYSDIRMDYPSSDGEKGWTTMTFGECTAGEVIRFVVHKPRKCACAICYFE